ncbi:hypothetical protein [Pseudomonas syringae]|uniref:hypothetical protein n=1 Tax=Pseudomonas syringae TaxID=317 RepID=UPI000A4065DE|nr:hypothetical protein [Pseudomonas syringae]
MSKLTRGELRYEYSWKTKDGDNPHLTHDDAKHLSLNEGYEMLTYLNHLGMSSDRKQFAVRSRLKSGKERSLVCRVDAHGAFQINVFWAKQGY